MRLRYLLDNLGLSYLKPEPFQSSGEDFTSNNSGPYDQYSGYKVETVGTSWLGTPVIDNIIIALGNDSIKINEVMMTVSMTKNIVKTFINGRKGSIKEYIQDGDYSISIIGGIYYPGATYPTDEVKRFIELLQKPSALKVSSNFLSYFGIGSMVVESYEMPQSKGFTNVQPFSVSAIDDTPIELLIK